VTLSFDFLTTNAISSSLCPTAPKVINVVEFPQAVYKISYSQTLIRMTKHARMHVAYGQTARKQKRSNDGGETETVLEFFSTQN